jgi:GT2 family glycosyltransferase
MNPAPNSAGPRRIAAIVVSYNGAPFIRRCLESLAQSSVKLDLIVVDNHSTDNTREIVSRFDGVKLIENSENVGFGRACNIGISYALANSAAYVLLLNQDAIIEPTMVEMLLRCMQAEPKIGIACPLQFDSDGKTIDHKFLLYYLAPFASRLISDGLREMLQCSYVVEMSPAAAWLISAACLREIGGFDPLFFMYFEDDDMSRRANYHGYHTVIVPAARFSHLRAFHGKRQESPWRRLKTRTSWIRSFLVASAKMPAGNPFENLYHAVTEQLCLGLASLAGHLQLIPTAACVLATCGTIMELPRILRHRRIALTKGAHWFPNVADITGKKDVLKKLSESCASTN